MLIDYHVHLEEGPYSFKWLSRTAKALEAFQGVPFSSIGSRGRLIEQVNSLQERMSKGCYSEEWLHLYLRKAKQLGIKEVGIVDHLYRFREAADYFSKRVNLDQNDTIGSLQNYWLSKVMNEEMEHFVEVILNAKKTWEKEGVQLKLGLEADYFPGGEEELSKLLGDYPWDFVIGSVHFVNGWGFDNPETIHIFNEWDTLTLYAHFYGTVEKMIRSGLFDFVAHLDNLKVFNVRAENESFTQTWQERIAQALIDTDTATEINAGLYYRYPVKEMCPGPDFLSILVNKNVSFTLSSDAHFPDDLGNYVAENAGVLREMGVKGVATFEKRKRIIKPL